MIIEIFLALFSLGFFIMTALCLFSDKRIKISMSNKKLPLLSLEGFAQQIGYHVAILMAISLTIAFCGKDLNVQETIFMWLFWVPMIGVSVIMIITSSKMNGYR